MNNPSLLSRTLRSLRERGPWWLACAVGNRVFPSRLVFKSEVLAAVRNARGLEIGGPSRVFRARQLLPVYPAAAAIDNVNFAGQTAWEDNLREGGDFTFSKTKRPGHQLIREASLLTGVPDCSYDFVLSSHCLEHLANPLRALKEWKRVTRPGGSLILLLPDPNRTFDHRRPITSLQHLRQDLAVDMTEDDTSHISEVLSLHDLSRDVWAGSLDQFRQRTLQNSVNRCIHHHVFDIELMKAALREAGWRVLATCSARPLHLVAWASNVSPSMD